MKNKESLIANLKNRYLEYVLQANSIAASLAIEEGLKQELGVVEIYLEILAPVQEKIGNMWHEGKINVAQEHLATEITLREMRKLREQFPSRIKTGLKTVVTSVEKEFHSVGARMVADFMYFNGWEVDFLGADVPSIDLTEFVRKTKPDLVALSITMSASLSGAHRCIESLKSLAHPPKVLVGGLAFQGDKELYTRLDADGYAADALEGVKEARRIMGIEEDADSLDNYLKRIGQQLQGLRKEKGWSQQQLAKTSGLDRTYISAMEHGKQNVTIGALYKLTKALNISMDHFLHMVNRMR